MEKKYLSKIIANDNEGLQMISACCEGAEIKVSEIKYLQVNKVFLLSLKRTKIETENKGKKVNSICKFEFVDSVKSKNIQQGNSDQKLELITIDYLKKNGCKKIALLKCTSSYPAQSKDINILTIPYLKEKFTAFYFNKIPVGYIIYNINMKNLYVVDLVVVPVNGTINANMIINEVLSYLDGYCVKKKLNYCKFELYLNNKLNNLLKNSLPRFSYISKKVDTNFSFKIFNKSVNKKIMMDAYLTNINKSGKIY